LKSFFPVGKPKVVFVETAEFELHHIEVAVGEYGSQTAPVLLLRGIRSRAADAFRVFSASHATFFDGFGQSRACSRPKAHQVAFKRLKRLKRRAVVRRKL